MWIAFLSLLPAGLFPLVPVQDAPGVRPRDMEEWGGLDAPVQLASLPSLIEELAPKMEMDVCYKGELLLRAKSLEVCQAVLDFKPAPPNEVVLLPLRAGDDAVITVYCLPDYGKALAPIAAAPSDYDAWVYGAIQREVFAFLKREKVDTLVLPKQVREQILHKLGSSTPRELGRSELWRLFSPEDSPEAFAAIFPERTCDDPPTPQQLLWLGRYGAGLAHLLSEASSALVWEWGDAALQELLQEGRTPGRRHPKVALFLPVSLPGEPRVPENLLSAELASDVRVSQAQWAGDRAFLQWWSSYLGLDLVFHRISFDLNDLTRYLAGAREPAADALVRRELLNESWILALEGAQVIPSQAVVYLPDYHPAFATRALEVWLERAQVLAVHPAGVYDEQGNAIKYGEYALRWAKSHGYPKELLERIPAVLYREGWSAPAIPPWAPAQVSTPPR